MREPEPIISLVIPTHNRSSALKRTLDALKRQTYPLDLMEVVVVGDGCDDDTPTMIYNYTAPYHFQFVEQPAQGPAEARNLGVERARGRLLIFLDDDIEAAPSLVEAHYNAHLDHPRKVAIGYLPPTLVNQTGFFRAELLNWWEAMFHPMRQPGHRFTYSNLLTGNFSIRRDFLDQVGGFNASLRVHEDFELGIRLVKAGASFEFVPDALGRHHENTDLRRSLRRKYDEGKADVLIGRLHPELRPVLWLAQIHAPAPRINRLLRELAFRASNAGDRIAGGLIYLLDGYEAFNLRFRWKKVLYALLDYWYWRGVMDELGSRQALLDFLDSVTIIHYQPGTEIELDLQLGLQRLEQRLDRDRPSGAFISFGDYPVGRIASRPGAERLRGAHLRTCLAVELSLSLLQTLARLERAGHPVDGDRDRFLSRFFMLPEEVNHAG